MELLQKRLLEVVDIEYLVVDVRLLLYVVLLVVEPQHEVVAVLVDVRYLVVAVVLLSSVLFIAGVVIIAIAVDVVVITVVAALLLERVRVF